MLNAQNQKAPDAIRIAIRISPGGTATHNKG